MWRIDLVWSSWTGDTPNAALAVLVPAGASLAAPSCFPLNTRLCSKSSAELAPASCAVSAGSFGVVGSAMLQLLSFEDILYSKKRNREGGAGPSPVARSFDHTFQVISGIPLPSPTDQAASG